MTSDAKHQTTQRVLTGKANCGGRRAMADPMVRQIKRACDDARRAWDAPGVMRVGSEPKVTLHESVLRRALLLLEKAERERDELQRELEAREMEVLSMHTDLAEARQLCEQMQDALRRTTAWGTGNSYSLVTEPLPWEEGE